MTSHVEAKCLEYIIECQYCKLKRKRRIIAGEHIQRCPNKRPLPCPNAPYGCTEVNIPQKTISKHRKVCEYENIQCKNKCGKEMQWRYLLDHVETECRHRRVLCQYCHYSFEHWYLEQSHMKVCSKFPLPCPNNCAF